MQIDSWWYLKGKGSGTKEWVPGPGVFPHGLAYLHNMTGWRITAHNRMWASDVVYATQNGGKWPGWIIGSSSAMPTDRAFWDWLLGTARKWGLETYEQDWLYTEFVGAGGAALRNATLGRLWMREMGSSAAALGLGVQLCMAWPRHVLQSLEMPSVTQARGSPDYNVHSEQWRVGDNALFLDPLGLRTTKDCFRSNTSSGERYPGLQAAVSSLSTGPVFPCDEIGTSDVGLLLRSCMSDGALLQPSRAAAPLDASIASKAGVALGHQLVEGELWRADSFIGAFHFPQVLAADFGGYLLSAAELLDDGEAAPGGGFAAVRHRDPHNVSLIDDAHPLRLPPATKEGFDVWSFAPVLSSGWALLGEQAKWVPVAPRRFNGISAQSGLTAMVHGPAGETVDVSLLPPSSPGMPPRPVSVRCVLPGGGIATLHAMPLSCA